MPRNVLVLMVVAASLVWAQTRPAASPARADGGVPAARVHPADAGLPALTSSQGGPTPEAERLRKELNELKLRTSELERQQQAKADTLNTELEKTRTELEGMRSQLTKLVEAEQRRADAEEAATSKKAATAAASTSLNGVLGTLSLGNTSGVEASLRYAETVFTGNAQRDVQLARAALAQGDLTAARGYLILALVEAEAQR